jgi:SAM-dependent methyltransferase
MLGSPIDWGRYLDGFHAARSGITEDVLGRAGVGSRSPYGWLTDGIDPDARILDLACGSAPSRPDEATRWVGLDRSAGELERAAAAGRRSLLRSDATRLPVVDTSVDVVVCAMGLMLVDPLAEALAEIARVLRPDGELRLLLPDRKPLSTLDQLRYLRLFWAARAANHFPPTPLRRHAAEMLAGVGLHVTTDESLRFTLPVDTGDEAARFVDSWYLPRASPAHRDAARRRAAALAPFDVGLPLRRVIAHPAHRSHGPRASGTRATDPEGTETIVLFTAFLAVPRVAPWLFSTMAALVAINVVQRLAWAGRHLAATVGASRAD